MAKTKGIFAHQGLLQPSAMTGVAERRFADAEALRRTDENARANGVAYLLGFVVEILLKAHLIRKYPAVARLREHDVRQRSRESHERIVWSLIWKQHDLDGMLEKLPEVEAALRRRGDRANYDYLSDLKKLCGAWTILARYSTRTMEMAEAAEMLERVRKLKEVLK